MIKILDTVPINQGNWTYDGPPLPKTDYWTYCSFQNLSDTKANEMGQQGWEAYAVWSGCIFFKRKLNG